MIRSTNDLEKELENLNKRTSAEIEKKEAENPFVNDSYYDLNPYNIQEERSMYKNTNLKMKTPNIASDIAPNFPIIKNANILYSVQNNNKVEKNEKSYIDLNTMVFNNSVFEINKKRDNDNEKANIIKQNFIKSDEKPQNIVDTSIKEKDDISNFESINTLENNNANSEKSEENNNSNNKIENIEQNNSHEPIIPKEMNTNMPKNNNGIKQFNNYTDFLSAESNSTVNDKKEEVMPGSMFSNYTDFLNAETTKSATTDVDENIKGKMYNSYTDFLNSDESLETQDHKDNSNDTNGEIKNQALDSITDNTNTIANIAKPITEKVTEKPEKIDTTVDSIIKNTKTDVPTTRIIDIAKPIELIDNNENVEKYNKKQLKGKKGVKAEDKKNEIIDVAKKDLIEAKDTLKETTSIVKEQISKRLGKIEKEKNLGIDNEIDKNIEMTKEGDFDPKSYNLENPILENSNTENDNLSMNNDINRDSNMNNIKNDVISVPDGVSAISNMETSVAGVVGGTSVISNMGTSVAGVVDGVSAISNMGTSVAGVVGGTSVISDSGNATNNKTSANSYNSQDNFPDQQLCDQYMMNNNMNSQVGSQYMNDNMNSQSEMPNTNDYNQQGNNPNQQPYDQYMMNNNMNSQVENQYMNDNLNSQVGNQYMNGNMNSQSEMPNTNDYNQQGNNPNQQHYDQYMMNDNMNSKVENQYMNGNMNSQSEMPNTNDYNQQGNNPNQQPYDQYMMNNNMNSQVENQYMNGNINSQSEMPNTNDYNQQGNNPNQQPYDQYMMNDNMNSQVGNQYMNDNLNGQVGNQYMNDNMNSQSEMPNTNDYNQQGNNPNQQPYDQYMNDNMNEQQTYNPYITNNTQNNWADDNGLQEPFKNIENLANGAVSNIKEGSRVKMCKICGAINEATETSCTNCGMSL